MRRYTRAFGLNDYSRSIDLIKISEEKYVWTYTDEFGVSVDYIFDDTLKGGLSHRVKFPEETVFKQGTFDGRIELPRKGDYLESFDGKTSRERDDVLVSKWVIEEYLIDELPERYSVHHDLDRGVFYLVDTEIHKKFSHYGGYWYHRNILNKMK